MLHPQKKLNDPTFTNEIKDRTWDRLLEIVVLSFSEKLRMRIADEVSKSPFDQMMDCVREEIRNEYWWFNSS